MLLHDHIRTAMQIQTAPRMDRLGTLGAASSFTVTRGYRVPGRLLLLIVCGFPLTHRRSTLLNERTHEVGELTSLLLVMKNLATPYVHSLNLARESRSLIEPNYGFECQLRLWEGCGYSTFEGPVSGECHFEPKGKK